MKHANGSVMIIVGLGNPGPKYSGTRHNIGFQCIDRMAKRWGIEVSERRAKAVLGKGSYRGQNVVLAKPRTFMNHSGEGLRYLLARFSAVPADLLVIYDEMALPMGKLRLRSTGSDAGHNGIRSIIDCLNTAEFPRLRIGIGRPDPESNYVTHVLDRFSQKDQSIIDEVVDRVILATECIIEESLERAMNKFN
mgnify:FL=1